MDNKNIKYKILKEAIHLIETIGWKDFSISKLSRIRNIEIHQIKVFFKTKTSILKEFTKMIDESVLEEISLEDSIIYPSPVPLERHISSLENSNPHPILLPILLYGKYTELDNGNSPITIYHGPPGTGKTHVVCEVLVHISVTLV